MNRDYNQAMAKAKKSEGSQDAAPAKKKSTAAKSGGGKQKTATPGPGAGGSPLVDTSLAAQTAAKMLLARAAGGGDAGAPRAETSTFKNLKESVQKPHLQGMNNLLNSTAPPAAKRSNTPFGQKQVGHNQTFGADVNRAGVPRRTGG